MNRLIIVGAGGHGKVIADNAKINGYTDIYFVDDNIIGECMGFSIIGKCCELDSLNDGKTDFIIGIGHNETRKAIAETYHVNWVSIIHPSAQISEYVSIGQGTVLMAGVIVNACASIGDHCIINTGSIIEHDNIIENFVHISPNVSLGGTVRICKSTHIGIGTTVSNNIDICGECIVGAGSVVIKNIDKKGIYYGVPAKIKK